MWTYLWPPLAGDLSEGFHVPSAQLGDWVSAESGMSMCASVVACERAFGSVHLPGGRLLALATYSAECPPGKVKNSTSLEATVLWPVPAMRW